MAFGIFGISIIYAGTVAAEDVSTDQRMEDAAFSEDLFDEYEQAHSATQIVADPIYYFNKAMFTFNDYFYFYGLKPVTQGYKMVVPTPVRIGIKNFFNNLTCPVRFINNILQGKIESAEREFTAFCVNSTIGVLGIYNYAQNHMDIHLEDEDLGQTLGVWGMGNGFYLVLPVLGPTTLRDGVGSIGDLFITPTTYVTPWQLKWSLRGANLINSTSFRIDDYEALKNAAIDPYIALRNAYIQNRSAKIDK